jgi:hypothetical protein
LKSNNKNKKATKGVVRMEGDGYSFVTVFGIKINCCKLLLGIGEN